MYFGKYFEFNNYVSYFWLSLFNIFDISAGDAPTCFGKLDTSYAVWVLLGMTETCVWNLRNDLRNFVCTW